MGMQVFRGSDPRVDSRPCYKPLAYGIRREGKAALSESVLMLPGSESEFHSRLVKRLATRVRNDTLLIRQQIRIPHDFPEVPVGIPEVARVAAPERLPSGLHDDRPGIRRLIHHGVDLLRRGNVVSE